MTGDINSFYVGDFPPHSFVSSGWQCPVCGRVYAPSVAICFTDHNQPTVTTSNGTLLPKLPGFTGTLGESANTQTSQQASNSKPQGKE